MKTKRHGSVHSVRSIQPVAYAGGRMKTSRLQSELTTLTFMTLTFFLKRKPQPTQSAHQTEHLKIGFLPQTQCKLSWWEKQKLKQMFLKLNQLEFLFPPFDPGDSSKNIWICVLTQIYIGYSPCDLSLCVWGSEGEIMGAVCQVGLRSKKKKKKPSITQTCCWRHSGYLFGEFYQHVRRPWNGLLIKWPRLTVAAHHFFFFPSLSTVKNKQP